MDKDLSKPLAWIPIVEAARESALYIDGRRKGTIKSLKTPWEKYNNVSMQGIEWNTIHSFGGMSGKILKFLVYLYYGNI